MTLFIGSVTLVVGNAVGTVSVEEGGVVSDEADTVSDDEGARDEELVVVCTCEGPDAVSVEADRLLDNSREAVPDSDSVHVGVRSVSTATTGVLSL